MSHTIPHEDAIVAFTSLVKLRIYINIKGVRGSRMACVQYTPKGCLFCFWLKQKLKELRVRKADSADSSQKRWVFWRMLGSGDSTD